MQIQPDTSETRTKTTPSTWQTPSARSVWIGPRRGVVAALMLAAGCSSPAETAASRTGSATSAEGGAGCEVHSLPSGTNLNEPVVSFVSDVFPIFSANCAFKPCHGSPDAASNQGLYLGGSAEDTSRALVGVPAPELPSMSFVTPGAPDDSYVMHKLDWDECQFGSKCALAGCGANMPLGGAQLPAVERDAIRRWIAQGATNG